MSLQQKFTGRFFFKVYEVLNNLVEANYTVQTKPSVAGLLPVMMSSNFRIA
jgi:hypothetical protein